MQFNERPGILLQVKAIYGASSLAGGAIHGTSSYDFADYLLFPSDRGQEVALDQPGQGGNQSVPSPVGYSGND